MRRFLRGLLALLVGLGLYLAFGPHEPLALTPRFVATSLPEDLDLYLAGQEAQVGGITPGTEKRIIWAGAAGARTDIAIVYLHGFSGTSEEIRPVPELVAVALGANLFYTRYAGHGLGGTRLAGPSVQDWMDDTAEALAIGRRIGKRVIVIATSTGGTLAAEAALQPDMAQGVAGIIFVSPNFGLRPLAGRLLTMGGVRTWGPIVAGDERCFDPVNDRQKTYWTTCYPTLALLPMAALAKHAGAADYHSVTVPALFLFSEADQVVSPNATKQVAASWGAPASILPLTVGSGDDPYAHVIAGDVLSPSMTAPISNTMLLWISGL